MDDMGQLCRLLTSKRCQTKNTNYAGSFKRLHRLCWLTCLTSVNRPNLCLQPAHRSAFARRQVHCCFC